MTNWVYKHGERKEGKLHKPFFSSVFWQGICAIYLHFCTRNNWSYSKRWGTISCTNLSLLPFLCYQHIHISKQECFWISTFVRISCISTYIQKSLTFHQGLVPPRLPKQSSPCHRNSALEESYFSILNQDPVLEHRLVPREAGNLDQVCWVSQKQTNKTHTWSCCQKKHTFILNSPLFLQSAIIEKAMAHKKHWK